MINYIRPSLRYFDHVVEELEIHNRPRAMTLSGSNVRWRANSKSQIRFCSSIFGSLLPTFSVTDSHRQVPSTSWKFGSDLTLLVNNLDTSFGSCEFLPLYSTAHQRLPPTRIARGFEVSYLTGQPRVLLPLPGLGDCGSSRHKNRSFNFLDFQVSDHHFDEVWCRLASHLLNSMLNVQRQQQRQLF